MIPLGTDACIEITVDRVEDAWAVVEWCGAVIGEVPVAAIAGAVREGDVLVVRTRRPTRQPRPSIFTFRNSSGRTQEQDNG